MVTQRRAGVFSLLSRRECLAVIGTMAVAGCDKKLSSSGLITSPAIAKTRSASSTTNRTLVSRPQRTFTPEEFGAAGDGTTNDTDAFARMAAAVNNWGGGTIRFRPLTYIIGKQGPDPTTPFAFSPSPVLEFKGCAGALTILGNGARLRCEDGLRYGTFDPQTGLPTQHPMPFLGIGEVAFPYRAMILAENCTGPIQIENFELDGNLSGLVIGGPYGDTGRQIPAIGLQLL